MHDLPFRASSFDAILLFHTLTYAEKPQRALEECARVLRPNGRVVPAFCRLAVGEWQLGERQLDVKVEQPGDSNGVQLY